MKVVDYQGTSLRISELCREKGYTAKDVAEALGLSIQTVYKYFDPNNIRIPSVDNLILLSELLDTPTDMILVRKEV